MRIFYRAISVLALCALLQSTASAGGLTADKVINETMTLLYVASGADDLTPELERIVTAFLADTSPCPDLILDMALTIPILRGMSADPSPRADSVSARLKREVSGLLLHGRTGRDGGQTWRSLYAVWSYACHAGDWAVVHDNWPLLRARFVAVTSGPTATARSNERINGLLAFARMSAHEHDPLAATAHDLATTSLKGLLDRIDSARSGHGDWSPGLDLSADIGRWIGDQRRDAAGDRIGALIHASGTGTWWCPETGVIDKSDTNRPAEIFLAKAWIIHEPGTALRKVRPCRETTALSPPGRDIAYLRIVQTLILKYSAVRWDRSW